MRIRLFFMAVAVACLFGSLAAEAQVNPFSRSGFELSAEDGALLKEASAKLYVDEAATVGTVEKWSNPKSGNSGTVELVTIFKHQEMPCRRLQHDIMLKRNKQSYRYILDRCKLPSGEWKIL